MATPDFQLQPAPKDPRRRELWMQHGAGLILFEDVRRYALGRLPESLSAQEREIAQAAVDDAVYGLMMVADGVAGTSRGDSGTLGLKLVVALDRAADGPEPRARDELDLADGDGMCSGFHGWLEGHFGDDLVATRATDD